MPTFKTSIKRTPRATSKNLGLQKGKAPTGDGVITGLPVGTLLRSTPPKSWERSYQVKVNKRFSGTTATGVSTLRFETESKNPTTNNIPPTHHTMVKLISPDHVWVHCECEDFMFRWEYALTQHGASSIINSNGEPALVRNPNNTPGVCLHLCKVLRLKSTMQRLEQLRDQRLAREAKGR